MSAMRTFLGSVRERKYQERRVLSFRYSLEGEENEWPGDNLL